MTACEISVVICTRDRAVQLSGALEALRRCITPDVHWEVLVIDNGSTDQTPGVVEQFKELLPLRSVTEPTPGLSAARNCGIGASNGKYLCWIDDDVRVPPRYLQAYARAFADHPETSFFGGPVVPVFSDTAPRWLREGSQWVGPAYAARPEKLALDGVIRRGRLPYGANFVLRRDLAETQPFRTELGRHPDHPERGGEELDVMHSALEHGAEGRWVREAKVEHHVIPVRETADWIQRYYRESGAQAGHLNRKRPRLQRTAKRMSSLARYVGHMGELALHSNDLNRPRRARNLSQIAWHAGFLFGASPRRHQL